jgi:membrane-associated phospholipid phosphatase
MDAGAIRTVQCEMATRLRSLSLTLVTVAVAVAIVLVTVAGVPVTARGAAGISLLFAVLMVTARWFRLRREDSPLGDALTAISLVWIVGLACGAISLMGVRLGRTLVDPGLLALDHSLGFDPIRYSNILGDTQLIWPLRYIYTLSLPMLFIGMLLQAMLGRRLALWRSVAGFAATLLATSLVSIFTPAKGFYVYAATDLVAKMPATAGTYFWKTFDLYHGGGPVVLGLGSIDGVVSFPSFHTIVALMTAALWRGHRLFPVAALWSALVIASAIPLGGHYLADVLGGAAIWLLWVSAERRWERSRPVAVNLPDELKASMAC